LGIYKRQKVARVRVGLFEKQKKYPDLELCIHDWMNAMLFAVIRGSKLTKQQMFED
jgi:hypothetical protein